MEDDNQINILDVIHGMNATDRVFYQTLRFLGSENDREALIHCDNPAYVSSWMG